MPIAIITGGATRIGAHISLYLARCGYDIIMHYHNSHIEADAISSKISNSGRQVFQFKANLSKTSERKKFVEFCMKHGANIELLINNAAVFNNDNIMSSDLESSLSEHLQVNTVAPIILSQEIVKIFTSMKKLSIINILDYGIFKTPHNFFSYHLSKKILYDWTQLAAKQLFHSARVNGIALGHVMRNPKQSKETFEQAIKQTLLECSGTLDEICGTISFINNMQSMTGQVICLDGGMHITDYPYC